MANDVSKDFPFSITGFAVSMMDTGTASGSQDIVGVAGMITILYRKFFGLEWMRNIEISSTQIS